MTTTGGALRTAAVIVDAVRTPFGVRDGELSHWHPVDLAAETLVALEARSGFDPEIVDDPDANGIHAITLSYTFYETDLPEDEYAALDGDSE